MKRKIKLIKENKQQRKHQKKIANKVEFVIGKIKEKIICRRKLDKNEKFS